jgi:hypothetical protein
LAKKGIFDIIERKGGLMEANTERAEPEFRVTIAQVWLFQVLVFSIPLAFLCTAIYCHLNQVPNPRSMVPKSIILLLDATAFILYAAQFELHITNPNTSSKGRRNWYISTIIAVPIFWILVISLRQNSQVSFTGDGDPVFPTMLVIFALLRFIAINVNSPKEGAAQ